MHAKQTAVDWLFILALAIIVIGLISKLPDADAPIEHDFGDYVTEQEQVSLPRSTAAVTDIREEDILPDPDEALPDPDEEKWFYRDDVPLDYSMQNVLHTACTTYGVPYELMLGLIEVESRFDPYAVSSAGCFGYCQLHPKYFGYDISPTDNLMIGTRTLAEKYEEYGYWEAALCAYNAGRDTGSRAYSTAVIQAALKWGWTP